MLPTYAIPCIVVGFIAAIAFAYILSIHRTAFNATQAIQKEKLCFVLELMLDRLKRKVDNDNVTLEHLCTTIQAYHVLKSQISVDSELLNVTYNDLKCCATES